MKDDTSWTYPNKLVICTWFGGLPIKCDAETIKRHLLNDRSDRGTSSVYAQDRGVTIWRSKEKGRYILEVCESNTQKYDSKTARTGNVVTLLSITFEDGELEDAIKYFITLARKPRKAFIRSLPAAITF